MISLNELEVAREKIMISSAYARCVITGHPLGTLSLANEKCLIREFKTLDKTLAAIRNKVGEIVSPWRNPLVDLKKPIGAALTMIGNHELRNHSPNHVNKSFAIAICRKAFY